MVIFINMNTKDKTLNLILRRVNPEYLENEFTECLDIESNNSSIRFRKTGSVISLEAFRSRVLSMTIDGIHNILVYTIPNDLQWYDDVYYALRKYYDERIEKKYKLLRTKYGLNESVIKILREETIQDSLLQMINNIGIKNASKAVGGMNRLIKILDYNWGPKLHNLYKEEVKKYGIYEFSINDEYLYAYLGEWDGYDYLYTLVISQWVNKELTLLFGDKWIPVFKKWFEYNSGLEVREIDLENKYLHL